MRVFNVELAKAKLNVLKTQRQSIRARFEALAVEAASVEQKLKDKEYQIDLLEAKVYNAEHEASNDQNQSVEQAS